jgi:hypothetical protein
MKLTAHQKTCLTVREDQAERYAYLVTLPGRTQKQQERVESWHAQSVSELAGYKKGLDNAAL